MIAKENLPHVCPICNGVILKGERYIYREKKKYPLGYSYFHDECF